MRYTEWVEAVLRAVLKGAGTPYMFGMPQIGTALGFEMGNWGDEEHRDLHLAIGALRPALGGRSRGRRPRPPAPR